MIEGRVIEGRELEGRELEDLLRSCAPQVLGALVRAQGDFVLCEDAVQEALLEASTAWTRHAAPEHPVAWLTTVAKRKLTDLHRREQARTRRETLAARQSTPTAPPTDDPTAGHEPGGVDDTLRLLLLCTHPSLAEPNQIALTLRAVGGLRTREIARAFLVPEATMAQRISRAKARIAASGAHFTLPEQDREARLAAALHVLYVIFDEGYTATTGPVLTRVDLTAHAIRLTRRLHDLLPYDGEITGLLALMLLTDARREARIDSGGHLVSLADQDRNRWHHRSIAEATTLLAEALAHTPLGPYQLQAAIAAVHAEAASDSETDWNQIVVLYRLLQRRTDNPVVTLNLAVAVGMAHGPQAGLDVLDTVTDDARLCRSHRPDAVRAHLLEQRGDHSAARDHYTRAARAADNQVERRYLEQRARSTMSSMDSDRGLP